MTVIVVAHERFHEHRPASWHPERPERLEAVQAGMDSFADDGALVRIPPRVATLCELERVHRRSTIERLEELDRVGGGEIDSDTLLSAGSWPAAQLAAGAGLAAVDALENTDAVAAFCAVRPPGHHAGPAQSMGFCLLNNAAVTAAALVERGERVAIIDIDAHHGNGTQSVFEADQRVLFVSLHQWPAYPGTGAAGEIGTGPGAGFTVNVPLPAETTGDVYLRAFDEIVTPELDAFAPTWVLVSAGYDSHRLDPLTNLGLTSADHGALVSRCARYAASGRLILFLEGGYHPEALTNSIASTFEVLLDSPARLPKEKPTTGGPGHQAVDQLIARRMGAI